MEDKPLSIALISDFFYPNLGGVEMHIYSQAYCLLERGHKVIVITRAYNNRHGIRYLPNGMKCYYLPISVWPLGNIIYPMIWGPTNFFLQRDVLYREKIDLLHIHQTTSTQGLDAINIASLLGIKTVVTDHSMWPLEQFGIIDINKIWKIQSITSHFISVSHAVRENYIVRANLDSQSTSVIPNAIDCSRFKPDPTKRFPLGTINIVVMSRLEYRKGFDLQIEVIPEICKKYDNVYWIIGGDGSKMPLLKFLVKKCNLEKKVEILGMVPQHNVQSVQNRGHIFINTSISEAFCIAVLEAVACGLKVVSTNIGGIPEILPREMILQCDPNSQSLLNAIERGIIEYKDFSPSEFWSRINSYYSWRDVAQRTEKVYRKQQAVPKLNLGWYYFQFIKNWTHWLQLVPITLCVIINWFLDLIYPRATYEEAQDFPCEDYKSSPDIYGDHNWEVTDPKQLGNSITK